MKKTFKALTIAGSDSGGGAGIQADLKTFCALDCYGTSVITALTAQNTKQVCSIISVPAKFVAQQLSAVIDDIGANAIKIGMVYSAEIIQVILKFFQHSDIPLIVDPVIEASTGCRLLHPTALPGLKKLFSFSTLITPNLPEASILLNRPISTAAAMEKAGKDLLKMGPKAVLIKGGHLRKNKGWDCLVLKDDIFWFREATIETNNTHGSGCTYSAAITAYMAHGYAIPEAICLAKEYLHGALKEGAKHRLGQGIGPLHHFWNRELK